MSKTFSVCSNDSKPKELAKAKQGLADVQATGDELRVYPVIWISGLGFIN